MAPRRKSAAASATRRTRRDVCVAEVCAALDAIAPFAAAEEWDNIGLLAGRPEWPARSVLLAIDLTDAVAREAIRKDVDTLLVYHPPIFKGIRSVTPDANAPTTLLPDLLAKRIAILATHTAFDAAIGGANDLLLNPLAPVERRPLRTPFGAGQMYKLVVFVPVAETDALRGALSAAGAGVIGHYAECSYETAGHGTFRGDATTRPSVGRKQVLERVEETRLEMLVPGQAVGNVVRALCATHSYEEPAFDLYPLHEVVGRGQAGMGRIGILRRPARGSRLVELLGEHVDLSIATVVGDLKRRFDSVTTAAGAFGVRDFTDARSLYITGELKHHDALTLLRRDLTAVCLGHYASERLVLGDLRQRLRAKLRGARVSIAAADRSPFQPLGL